MGFDEILKTLENSLKGLIGLLDFFRNSGMKKFEYNLGGKYDLTIYEAGTIIRIDIKPIKGSNSNEG